MTTTPAQLNLPKATSLKRSSASFGGNGRRDAPDINFDDAVADPAVVEEAWRAWREEIAFADKYVAEASDLGVLGGRPDDKGDQRSLRWVLVHMIEEYARHLGHADLLRERIDGRVGM